MFVTSLISSLSVELPAKVAKTELNKSFRYIDELTTFSGCIYFPVIPLNTQNTFDFTCWLTDEVKRLFRLHGCGSYLDARSSVLFRVNFFGHFSPFLKALIRPASWYCFRIVSSPFSSTDLIQLTALFSVQYNLASFLILGRGRSLAIFFAFFWLLLLAFCRSLSCCASDKLYLKR